MSFGIRTKLTALYLAIFGSTLIIFCIILFKGFVVNHEREFDVALYNYTIDVTHSIELDLFGGVTLRRDVLKLGAKVFPFSLGNAFIQIRSIEGEIVEKSPNLLNDELPFDLNEQAYIKRHAFLFKTEDLSRFTKATSSSYRVLDYFIDRPGDDDFVLQVAVPMLLLEREKRGLIFLLSIMIPTVLLIATFGGLYISRKALAPVNSMILQTQQIRATDLQRRVEIPRAKDEIQKLALTLNDLLQRLEAAFKSQEMFVANASHELKTPLAVMRGELEVLQSRERSREEVDEFLISAQQEIGFLTRMVEDLLLLARVDSGEQALLKSKVRLDELVVETVSRIEKLARTKNIRFKVNFSDPDARAQDSFFELDGDSDLLRCLIFNLLENAVKYSPDQAVIEVSVRNESSNIIFSVIDHGSGIPEAEKERIFDKFYRGENRKMHTRGVGLGLALAKKIAEFHDAKILVESQEGITEFRVVFKIN